MSGSLKNTFQNVYNLFFHRSVDAVFISPHKFLGGPQTPGILVAKKHLFRNKVPVIPGGGTVNYVSLLHVFTYLVLFLQNDI